MQRGSRWARCREQGSLKVWWVLLKRELISNHPTREVPWGQGAQVEGIGSKRGMRQREERRE